MIMHVIIVDNMNLRRCQKLFNKASRYHDGTKLVIVAENS